MNHAHTTHYTDSPDPAIKHVLRGWAAEYGKPVRHDVQIRDVRVRNGLSRVIDITPNRWQTKQSAQHPSSPQHPPKSWWRCVAMTAPA